MASLEEFMNGDVNYKLPKQPRKPYVGGGIGGGFTPNNDWSYKNPQRAGNTYTAQPPADPSKFTGYDFGAHQGQQFDYRNPAEGAKYAVSNYLANVDPNSDWAPDAVRALNEQFGQNIFSANGGRRISYGDEFVDSDPNRFGGKFFWGSSGPSSGGAGGAGGSGGTGGSGGLGGGSGSAGDAIRRLLARGEKPVTAEDVSSQYQPVAASLERGGVKARAESALRRSVEGSGAIGGGGGANDSDVNAINENVSDRQSTLMAQLMGDEISSRRQDVVNALQFAQGEERMALERQLSTMDNELRRLQMGQQDRQFYDQFSYQMGRDNQDDTLQQILAMLR